MSGRKHMAKRWFRQGGMTLRCTCGEYATFTGTRKEQDGLHREHRIAMGDTVLARKQVLPDRDAMRIAVLCEAVAVLGAEAFWFDPRDRQSAMDCLLRMVGDCDPKPQDPTLWPIAELAERSMAGDPPTMTEIYAAHRKTREESR